MNPLLRFQKRKKREIKVRKKKAHQQQLLAVQARRLAESERKNAEIDEKINVGKEEEVLTVAPIDTTTQNEEMNPKGFDKAAWNAQKEK